MSNSDYICIDRAIIDHKVVRQRMHMLALVTVLYSWAHWENSTARDERHPEVLVVRGQLAASEGELRTATGIASSTLHRALVQLACARIIRREVRESCSVITLLPSVNPSEVTRQEGLHAVAAV